MKEENRDAMMRAKTLGDGMSSYFTKFCMSGLIKELNERIEFTKLFFLRQNSITSSCKEGACHFLVSCLSDPFPNY